MVVKGNVLKIFGDHIFCRILLVPLVCVGEPGIRVALDIVEAALPLLVGLDLLLLLDFV